MCPLQPEATSTTATSTTTTVVVFVAVNDVATTYKYTPFKLQNSIYVFYQNIKAFQAFVMSCFGQ